MYKKSKKSYEISKDKIKGEFIMKNISKLEKWQKKTSSIERLKIEEAKDLFQTVTSFQNEGEKEDE